MRRPSLPAIALAAGLTALAAVLVLTSPDPARYVDVPGLIIVLGGTLLATRLSYPWRDVRRLPRSLASVMRADPAHDAADIDTLVQIAQASARADMRKAEALVASAPHPFLRDGAQLVLDNTASHDIAELLQWRVARQHASDRAQAAIFRTMAGFAPAFGMLGTLVGLINLLHVLGVGDMDAMGRHMGIAFMTTFYGILLANLVCRPIAVKLERRAERRAQHLDTLLQGIVMMADKRSPAFIRESLHTFAGDTEDASLAMPGPPGAPPARR